MFEIINFIYLLFLLISMSSAFNCKLPSGCKIGNVHHPFNLFGYEKTSLEIPGLLCDIRDEQFQFKYPMPWPLLKPYDENDIKPEDQCEIDAKYRSLIEFRFHNNLVLNRHFNLTNLLDYLYYFRKYNSAIFVNLNGFELDILNDSNQNSSIISQGEIEYFNCIKCKMDFYSNGRLLQTCQDIIDSNQNNNSLIRSLFQIQINISIDISDGLNMILFAPQFKTILCPLVFTNSNITYFNLIGLSDRFYKKNLLKIENRTFDDLKSRITYLQFINVDNINIDSNLLNPSVFRNTEQILFSGQVNMIDGNSLNALGILNKIEFLKDNYREMIHKNGIKWMRYLNPDLNVNLSNFREIEDNYYSRSKLIEIVGASFWPNIRLSKLFPDEDFCLYKDFPFKQLVILMESAFSNKVFELLYLTRDYKCTYLWLAQYFHIFLKIANNIR